jgi:hypothetical protein
MPDFTAARKKLEEQYAPKGPGTPPASYRASMIGRPCARYLVFARTPESWNLRKPADAAGEFEMKRGREAEHQIIGLAEKALSGIFDKWVYNRDPNDQDPRLDCRDDALDVNGKVDALANEVENGKLWVFEAKHVSTFTFEKVDTAEDIKNAEEHWLQAWYGALQAYLFNKSIENGCWILGAKQRVGSEFPVKFIPVTLDYEWFQQPIDRIQLAERHRKAGTLPDPIPYTKKGCGSCEFLAVCGNDPRKLPANPNLPPELEENLNREFELKPAAAEYEKVKAKNREATKGIEQAVCGKYYIVGKEQTRTTKPSEGKTSTFWQTKVEEITD